MLLEILNLFLSIVPYQVIRLYPFWDKLRISKRGFIVVLIILDAILILGAPLLGVFSPDEPFLSPRFQIYRGICATILFVVVSLFIKREYFFKQLFLYYIATCFMSLNSGVAHFIALHFDIGQSPYLLSNIVHVAMMLLTVPAFVRFEKRMTPTIEGDNSRIWKFIWLVPTLFFSCALLFTLGPENLNRIVSVIGRSVMMAGSIVVSIILMEAIRYLKERDEAREHEQSLIQTNEQLEKKTGGVTKIGPLIIDQIAGRAEVDGKDALLTAREFAILGLLARQHGEYISTDEIFERVWNREGDKGTVKTHIYRMRRKLVTKNSPYAIIYQNGKGYSFQTEVEFEYSKREN